MDRRLPRDEDGLAPDRGLRRVAVRPTPRSAIRRPGDHLRVERQVERRVFIQAPPRVRSGRRSTTRPALSALLPELHLGPAEPAWPAAATTRSRPRPARPAARDRAGREPRGAARVDLPGARVSASGFESEWMWRLEPVAGGTRVIHAATFETNDRWARILVRLGRSLGSRVEATCALKERPSCRARPGRAERADGAADACDRSS